MPDSIVIITSPEVGIGYKLAGVQVFEATKDEIGEVNSFLKRAIKDQDIGLIGVDEEIYAVLNPRLLEAIKKRGKPLLLSLQSIIRERGGITSVEDYIRDLTLKTAGIIVNVEKDS
jgi:vacuolar-type H+-ATPase subunit F/Vma7